MWKEEEKEENGRETGYKKTEYGEVWNAFVAYPLYSGLFPGCRYPSIFACSDASFQVQVQIREYGVHHEYD